MNKFQAIAQAMALLNKNGGLKQGSREYKTVKNMISSKIDRLGPEGALKEIRRTMTRLLAEIRQMERK